MNTTINIFLYIILSIRSTTRHNFLRLTKKKKKMIIGRNVHRILISLPSKLIIKRFITMSQNFLAVCKQNARKKQQTYNNVKKTYSFFKLFWGNSL